MGLLDAFGQGFDSPQSAMIQGLAQGLLSGNFGAGLGMARKGAMDAKRGLLADRMGNMQLEQHQMALEQQRQAAEQAKRKQEFLANLPSPQMQAASGAMAGGGGPTMENAAQIPQVDPMQQMMFQGVQAGAIPLDSYLSSMKPKSAPIKDLEAKDFTPESLAKFAQSRNYGDLRRLDKLHFADTGGGITGMNPFTGEKVSGVAKSGDPFKDLLLSDGAGGMRPNAPLIGAKSQIAKAGASSVSVNTGQKGLDNELKIRSDFRSEPIYKAHQDVQSAHAQITQSLAQASPAGDLAGATKLMKILDPGSVVRESELGMAMQASGLMDRVENYGKMVLSGQKLTPSQRADFKKLADTLNNESVKQYNSKRKEYSSFATGYQLDGERILGPELKERAAPSAASSKAPPVPMKGMVRGGYKYKGGDPASASSWEKQ